MNGYSFSIAAPSASAPWIIERPIPGVLPMGKGRSRLWQVGLFPAYEGSVLRVSIQNDDLNVTVLTNAAHR